MSEKCCTQSLHVSGTLVCSNNNKTQLFIWISNEFESRDRQLLLFFCFFCFWLVNQISFLADWMSCMLNMHPEWLVSSSIYSSNNIHYKEEEEMLYCSCHTQIQLIMIIRLLWIIFKPLSPTIFIHNTTASRLL
jgi:hypothetical protein